VLYASGFSKTVAPGSRIGYLLVGERFRDRILRIKQAADISTPGLNQRAMADLITSGTLTLHLERVRKACRIRRDVFFQEWQQTFGDWTQSIPEGGLYLWTTLPAGGPSTQQLFVQSRNMGVDFALGADFSPNSHGSENNAIRLNFAAYPARVLVEGIRRLRCAYDKLR
jgi:2-aminoadipate transaminase